MVWVSLRGQVSYNEYCDLWMVSIMFDMQYLPTYEYSSMKYLSDR